VGFVVDKVALGQVFVRVLRFSPLNVTDIPLHGNTKKLIIFITGLHNKPQGCGESVASAAGPFTTKKLKDVEICLAVTHIRSPEQQNEQSASNILFVSARWSGIIMCFIWEDKIKSCLKQIGWKGVD
jgi:hypothetical protein